MLKLAAACAEYGSECEIPLAVSADTSHKGEGLQVPLLLNPGKWKKSKKYTENVKSVLKAQWEMTQEKCPKNVKNMLNGIF